MSNTPLAEWERRELETLRALAKNLAGDKHLKELAAENQRLMAEVIKLQELLNAHHAVDALRNTLIGDRCPVCAAMLADSP